MLSRFRPKAVRFIAALCLLALTADPASAQTPAPAASGDPYAFFLGDWTCRTGYNNVAHKSYARADGGVTMSSAWGTDGANGGTIAERYGTNGSNLTASTEFRGADGVRAVGDYFGAGWHDDTLTFVGRFAGNIGRGNQAMIYTRLDANTFERRFVTGPPAQVTSVERCERGHTVPQSAPTMPPE